MARRRSLSLSTSTSPFLPVIDREDFVTSGTGNSTLAALSLPLSSGDGDQTPSPATPTPMIKMESQESSVSIEIVSPFPLPRTATFRPLVKRPGTVSESTQTRPMPQRSSTIDTRAIPKLPSWDTSHPFDAAGFERGLKAAGYLETLEVSRKKIKIRFMHALNKEQFKVHFDHFLKAKSIKKRGEFMIRFLGEQDVHSPFVHIYTTTLPEDTTTIKIRPTELDDGKQDNFTLWTFLRTIKGASHWSCKAKGFWPLRVVLEGDEPKSLIVEQPPPEDNAPKQTRTSKSRTIDIDNFGSEVTLTAPDASLGVASAETPTILESVKQLGQSFAKTLPPSVQTSIERLPETFSTRIGALKNSFAAWATPKVNELERMEEEMEESREERRRRRAERKAREREDLEAEDERLNSLARRERRSVRRASMFT